ncbi:MAG TPA: ABC transporter substrate-binding protein [Candidatus Binatia bacterium]
MRKAVVGIGLLILSLVPLQVRAESALDVVKARVNLVLGVLRDPALKADSPSVKEQKKKKLRAIFDQIFDYGEMSRAVLSRNWEKLSPQQQTEFSGLFKTLLEKFYADTILSYKDQQVTYGKERALGENRFEVETKLISGSTETPINFRLVQKNGEWWVYDFSVEGISVVTNYRSQFNRVLSKETPEGMLVNLRKQVAGLSQ